MHLPFDKQFYMLYAPLHLPDIHKYMFYMHTQSLLQNNGIYNSFGRHWFVWYWMTLETIFF